MNGVAARTSVRDQARRFGQMAARTNKIVCPTLRANPLFSRQNCRGGPLRPPREVLTGLGWVIEWDGVCISRMGGHGGPPVQTKPVQTLVVRTLVRNAD